MGAPAFRPYAKHALMIPENTATTMPFEKLNSLMAARFLSSGISRSLDSPARAATAMPARHTPTPSRMIFPEVLPAIATSCPLKIGGTSVPNAAQNPRATPMPSDMPR